MLPVSGQPILAQASLGDPLRLQQMHCFKPRLQGGSKVASPYSMAGQWQHEQHLWHASACSRQGQCSKALAGLLAPLIVQQNVLL